MNVKRFTGRNSREAMQKVRQAFGENAVVLSTKPCEGGIEVLAMAPESVEAIEHYRESEPGHLSEPVEQRRSVREAISGRGEAGAPARSMAPAAAPRTSSAASASASNNRGAAPPQRVLAQKMGEPADTPVQEDVSKLAMSTLSFQDYVRERMLKKRDAELREKAQQSLLPDALEDRLSQRSAPSIAPQPDLRDAPAPPSGRAGLHGGLVGGLAHAMGEDELDNEREESARMAASSAARARRKVMPTAASAEAPSALRRRTTEPTFRDEAPAPRHAAPAEPAPEQGDMMRELRAMKGLIEERFGALAFMERLQKSPKQAQLITRLIDCGFSPALIRKLVESVGDDMGDEVAWATEVLQRNLLTGEQDAALEDQGGVFAIIGSTGVGKTTSTAKLAAAFAARHGAGNLGLITLDAYRLGAHEQLRAYGRILGVPVHTAHDRVALEDLLDLLSAKKLVLIDTAGLAQRDTRTRELLEMLSHPSINRLLVVNAAAQGETIEDVLNAYKAAQAKGVILSKLDEAVKLAPALDAMIRNRLKVVAVANGQRVPEDWHRLTAQALVHRALRATGTHAWRMDANEVNLLFANAGSPPSASVAAKRSRSSSTTRRPAG